MIDSTKNIDEALKEIKLQKMLLGNLGITSRQVADEDDVHFLVERVMNTCFMPSDCVIVYRFYYENHDIGSCKLYVNDTGDCAVAIDIEKHHLHTEVIKQLLLLGYKHEGRSSNWLTYLKRVY